MAQEFVDLSGIATENYDNPYDALIEAADDEHGQIQQRYTTHRTTRNLQQRAKILDRNFSGFNLDSVLQRLLDSSLEPGYVDPRNCLVFWARPTSAVKRLVDEIQRRLLDAVPSLWTMPLERLHLTALEVTHSRGADDIRKLVEHMQSSIPAITDYTYDHRARLIKPMLGYDAAAIALSFVPAAGEALTGGRTSEDDKFSYHHLRRDLFNLCRNADVKIDSRYVVPSSHLTIARFVTIKDFTDHSADGEPPRLNADKLKSLIDTIEGINTWLMDTYWPQDFRAPIKDGGEWIVGEEKGLDCQSGTLWYGDGIRVRLGRGF